MLDAAREARQFAEGKTRDHLNDNRMLVLALTKDIEIIGEAASKISKTFQAAHPHIPWAVIVGMRNMLIHAYFDVDLDEVWSTLQNDLPRLIEQLDSIVLQDDDTASLPSNET